MNSLVLESTLQVSFNFSGAQVLALVATSRGPSHGPILCMNPQNNEITIFKPCPHMYTHSCLLVNPSLIATTSLQVLDVIHGLLLAFTSEQGARLHLCPRLL